MMTTNPIFPTFGPMPGERRPEPLELPRFFHPRPHHRPGGHQPESAGTLAHYIEEIRRMGASDHDLHAVVDGYVAGITDPAAAARIAGADPGRRVDPAARAMALSGSSDAARRDWIAGLRGKSVLAAGQFPPHLLEELLANGIAVTQIHPPTHDGNTPPHFRHLAGLRGITELQELAAVRADVILIHGALDGGTVRVSSLVPIVLRIFPAAEVQVAEADHVAPHMALTLSGARFSRVPVRL